MQPDHPDARVVARLVERDEATFADLVDRWSGSMLRVASSIVTTRASAAEVVQDTWLAVVRSISDFEGRASLRTWVYRILVNTAKRRAAQEARAVPWSSLDPDDGRSVSYDRFQGPDDPYPGHWRTFPEPWPEDALLRTEVTELIRRCVESLPPQQRAVITLRDIDGWDAAETCELLGLSEGNQRVLLHRARTAVRSEVADYLAHDSREDGR